MKIFEKKNFDGKLVFSKALAVIVVIFLIVFAGLWIFQSFVAWQASKQIDEVQSWLDEMEQLGYEMAMADTHGGTTPHETLEMYIEAIEAGDYELASKYFIIPKQEEERELLNKTSENFKSEFITLLKEGLDNEGSYSLNEKYFSIQLPVRISFALYPNGIWKIQSI